MHNTDRSRNTDCTLVDRRDEELLRLKSETGNTGDEEGDEICAFTFISFGKFPLSENETEGSAEEE